MVSCAAMGNKGETQPTVSTRHTNELQKLSSRMEEMAAKFTKDLDSFKKELQSKVDNINSADETRDVGDLLGLQKKFLDFEKSIGGSLCDLREEVDRLRLEGETMAISANNNAILIHGLHEDQHDDLYDNVIKLITSKIGTTIDKNDLNYCHRLGPKKQNAANPRPVIVSFCRRWMRDHLFYKKKLLKGTKYLFTELLTAVNLKLFKEARTHFKNACWTKAGKIYVFDGGAKTLVRSTADLSRQSE